MEHTAGYCVKLTNNAEKANGAENDICVKAKKILLGFAVSVTCLMDKQII